VDFRPHEQVGLAAIDMISDIILNFIYAVIHWLLSGILSQADVSVGSGFVQAILSLMSVISALNALIPTGYVFLADSFILVVETAVMGYKAVMFVVKKIPGLN